MLYYLGRFLQLIGLILLPVAIAGEVSQSLNFRDFYIITGIGILLFTTGWLLQRNTKSS